VPGDAELRPGSWSPTTRRQRERIRLAVEGDRFVVDPVAGKPVAVPLDRVARIMAVEHTMATTSTPHRVMSVLVLDSAGHRLVTVPWAHSLFKPAEIRDFCRRAGISYGAERQPDEGAVRRKWPEADGHRKVRTMAGGRTMALIVAGLLLGVIAIGLIVSLLR
jgi:hypothetical protein